LLKRQVLTPGVLSVHDQRQLFLKGEIPRRFFLFDGFQSIYHALQSHVDEFFDGWLV